MLDQRRLGLAQFAQAVGTLKQDDGDTGFDDLARHQTEGLDDTLVGNSFAGHNDHVQISTSLYLSVFRSISRCRRTETKSIAKPP